MSNHHSSRWRVEAPPLSRAWLDAAAPVVRVVFGLLFLAWSWVSTVLIIYHLLRPVLPGATLGVVPDRILVGVGFALLVSLAEFVASDRWPGVYWAVVLTLDADFTAYQTHDWLERIVRAQTAITLEGQIGLWALSLLGGIVAAKFGEVLLFGRSQPVARSA